MVGNTFQSRIPSHIINCLFQLLYSSCFISKRHFQIADMHIHPSGDITLLSLTDWLCGPWWHSVLICWLRWCLQAHKGSRWGVLGSPVYCGTIIRFSAASALGLQYRHTSRNFRGLPSSLFKPLFTCAKRCRPQLGIYIGINLSPKVLNFRFKASSDQTYRTLWFKGQIIFLIHNEVLTIKLFYTPKKVPSRRRQITG